MKCQIYLSISEAQPNFKLRSRLKLVQPNLPFPTAGDLKVQAAKQIKVNNKSRGEQNKQFIFYPKSARPINIAAVAQLP